MAEWVQVILRHGTTIAFVLAAVWWLATPRAEEFVQQAVDERISKVEAGVDAIETKTDDLKSQIQEVIRRLERIERDTQKIEKGAVQDRINRDN